MHDVTSHNSLPATFGTETLLPVVATQADSAPTADPLQSAEQAIEQVDRLRTPDEPTQTPVEDLESKLDRTLDGLEQSIQDHLAEETKAPGFERAVSIVLTLRGVVADLEAQVEQLRQALPAAEVVLIDAGVAAEMRATLERITDSGAARVVWNASHPETARRNWLGGAATREILVMLEPGCCGVVDLEPLVTPVLKRCCGAVYGVPAQGDTRLERRRCRLLRRVTERMTGQAVGALPTGCRVIRTDLLSGVGTKPLGSFSTAALTAKLARRGVSIYEMPVHASRAWPLPTLWQTVVAIGQVIRYSLRD